MGDLLHASRKAQQADTLRHKLEGVEAWMQARRCCMRGCLQQGTLLPGPCACMRALLAVVRS